MQRQAIKTSSIQTCRLDFGRLDLVFLDFLIEGAARDPETLGSFLDAAALLLKNPFDVLLFEFLKSEA